MGSSPSMHSAAAGAPIGGVALVFFAFDVGFQIDLDVAAALGVDVSRQRAVRARRPAPEWFDYSPAPVRLTLDGEPVEIAGRRTEPLVEALVYDFGAALLCYRLPLPPVLEDLPALGAGLHASRALEAAARSRVQRLVDAIGPAIERPHLSDASEDYTVFSIVRWEDGATPDALLDRHRAVIAGAIEGEAGPLAPEQAARSTEGRMSYATSDLAIIDWNAAVLFDPQPEDVIAVLEHANVELLELRVLDLELDDLLDHADETLAALVRRRLWPAAAAGRLLRQFASAQTDAAVMFEGVDNAIKLLGNQYLARIYRLAAARLDLPAWQQSVQRKLDATDSLYQKMSDTAATRRLETLEWVIIVLIAVSVLLPFAPWYGH